MRSSNKDIHLTRRRFVAIGAIGGAAVVIGCTSHKRADWEFLSDGHTRFSVTIRVLWPGAL